MLRKTNKGPSCGGLFNFQNVISILRLRKSVCSLAVGLTFLVGCTFENKKTSTSPVLTVNKTSLTAKEFSEDLARRLKNFNSLEAKDPNIVSRSKEEIVSQYIIKILIRDYCSSVGITVSESELDKEINKVRSSFPDDYSFRNSLATEGISFAKWKEDLTDTILNQKLFQSFQDKIQKPSEADLQRIFDANKEKYKRKERIYLRQIVLDDLAKAESVKEELKKKDFIELAKKYSVSPEAKNGGLVGWIEKNSVDIFDKAFALPIGGISPVLESSYGFHIFKVDKKEPAGYLTFQEVRGVILSSYLAQKEQAMFTEWLDKQIRSGKVFKNVDLIKNITVETKGKVDEKK